jgi:FAD-dependent oxidoreductase domain-containing protein 1
VPKIVIIGGGIMGSGLAWHLAKAGAAADVVVIEPDPTYEFAATPRAVGGIRFVQGLRQNLEMSLYGLDVYREFSTLLETGGDPADVGLYRCGYIFLGRGDDVRGFEADHRMLTETGAAVQLLDRPALQALMPSFNFDDVDAALYSPEDSRIDPHAALQGYRRAAIHLGIAYRKDRVTAIDHDAAKVTGLRLESGERLDADLVVNAANCWAPEVCRMVGMEIPVEPVQRQTFFFDIQGDLDPFPGVRDHTGLSVRPDGTGYIAGKTAAGCSPGFDWELDHREFDDVLWPLMAHRNKRFEAVKYKGGWVGHYDQNRLDGNPILGPWVGGLENFIVAAGFSGHGLQHAPAVTRGLSELILHGEYRSIDLSIFSYRRVIDGTPIPDSGPTP